MQPVARYRPRHQRGALILTLAFGLAGCASAPEVKTVVKMVDAPLPKPPAAAMTAPADLPLLPERPVPLPEFAQAYADLQARYLSETARFRLLQSYVRKLRRKQASAAR
jgi:hypothetical protein